MSEMQRRYKTDYAGMWCGFCISRESAIIAAIKHVVNDGYSRATIIDRVTDQDIARISLSKDRTKATVETVKPFVKPK